MGSHLHVVQLGFFNDPQERTPWQLLDAWPTIVDVAEAARSAGLRVSVVQASAHRATFEAHGVDYHFLPLGATASSIESHVALQGLLRRLAPDVLHVHGLDFHRDICSLAAIAPTVPIILQDHASKPPRWWRRSAARRALSLATGVVFCALPQAHAFTRAGVLPARMALYEIPESTSRFTPGEREAARRITGLHGNPALLWIGHLDANKDPLTALAGIARAAPTLPDLQLWCCFASAPLLREVQGRVAAAPGLRGRVHLLGRVAHEYVEQLMRAADLFVLASHREGSGYSLIEALACGLPPVVTDIPSFRVLTGDGLVGQLWPCGDATALCAAVRAVAGAISIEQRRAVRAHFDRELSIESLGAQLAGLYTDVVNRHAIGNSSGGSQARASLPAIYRGTCGASGR